MYGFSRLTISIPFSKWCRSFFVFFFFFTWVESQLHCKTAQWTQSPATPSRAAWIPITFFLSVCFCWWQKPFPSLRLHNSLQICKDEPFRLSSWSTPEQLLIPSVPNTPLNNNLIIYNHTLSNITPKHSYSYFKEILQCQILNVCFQKASKEKWVTALF